LDIFGGRGLGAEPAALRVRLARSVQDS
jgi:hypothetical protein